VEVEQWGISKHEWKKGPVQGGPKCGRTQRRVMDAGPVLLFGGRAEIITSKMKGGGELFCSRIQTFRNCNSLNRKRPAS